MATQPRLNSIEDRAVLDHLKGEQHRRTPRRAEAPISRLTIKQSALAFVAFIAWLILFAAGIVVDTTPYRTLISPSGGAAPPVTERSAAPVAPSAAPVTPSVAPVATQAAPVAAPVLPSSQVLAWFVVVTCYLPLNLAWVCALASALGAFGNLANLADDRGERPRDNSNPYLSALLRGFFVYLFMTSGLLLLDDAPFMHPTPEQYIRLAGFLSLFSFVVSYQPRLFNILIVWAFHRISVREGEEADEHSGDSSTIYAKQTTLEVAATRGPAADRHAADRHIAESADSSQAET